MPEGEAGVDCVTSWRKRRNEGHVWGLGLPGRRLSQELATSRLPSKGDWGWLGRVKSSKEASRGTQ